MLNGSGIGDHFTGILHRAGLAAPIASTGTENNADAILRQITAIETATQDVVSGIVMNPANWNAVGSLKDSTGNYIGSGPFETPGRKTLWGREVAVTPAQAAGTATVGAFRRRRSSVDGRRCTWSRQILTRRSSLRTKSPYWLRSAPPWSYREASFGRSRR